MVEHAILRHRHEVLEDFSEIMYRHDPMGINSPDTREYEGEALSILSRFTEQALHLTEDENEVFELAAGVITQCLNFWFDDDTASRDLSALTVELLTVYLSSYPGLTDQANEKQQPEVVV